MQREKIQRFNSAKDAAIVGIFLACSAVLLSVAFQSFQQGWNPGAVIMGGICLATSSFLIWLILGTYYTVMPNELRVYSGPFRFKIRIEDITKISASNNLISSPAMSMDRLKIDYSQREIYVSPKDKLGFLRLLVRLNPQIVVDFDI